MTEPRIELTAVTKRYGTHEAVNGVSLAVPPGECLALVGHNGAGKTTLMKLMLGLTRPSEGRLRVLGVEPGAPAAVETRRAIGFLPENVAFHDGMTGAEVLAFFARLKGRPVAESRALLERVGMDTAADRRVKTYSKGMRQRLGLAQALLGTPRLLLLDEPTAGLDPALRSSFFEIIRELTAGGVTVVLSSHVLTELEARTDRVAVMNRGRLVVLGSLGELRHIAGLPVRIRVAVPEAQRSDLIARLGGAQAATANGRWVELACTPGDKIAALRRVTALDVPIEDIDIVQPTLNDLYAYFSRVGRAA